MRVARHTIVPLASLAVALTLAISPHQPAHAGQPRLSAPSAPSAAAPIGADASVATPPFTATPPGGPAIQPEPAMVAAATAAVTAMGPYTASTQAFQAAEALYFGRATYTVDDARQYVTLHMFAAHMLLNADGTQPQIAKLEFISAGEAGPLGARPLGVRPATTLVCYVELHGAFTLANAPRPYMPARVYDRQRHRWVRTRTTEPSSPIEYVVFDAQTGNMLMGGIRG